MLAVAREVHLEFALALVLAVLASYQTPDPVQYAARTCVEKRRSTCCGN